MDRLKLFAPLLIFVVLAGLFFFILSDEDYDPQRLPSALIDKPLPEFSLPSLLQEGMIITPDNLKGEVALLNVWATWCPSCVAEHPYLIELTERESLPVYGINYKDEDQPAREWLARLGNPYRLVIVDADGRLGLDLGVYGAPETYLIDTRGVIRFKHVGVVNERVWREKFRPIVEALRTEGVER